MASRNVSFSDTITITINPGGHEQELAVEIEGTYTPGSPATGPTHSCGGTPADGAEFEITSATGDVNGEEIDFVADLTDGDIERIQEKGIEQGESSADDDGPDNREDDDDYED